MIISILYFWGNTNFYTLKNTNRFNLHIFFKYLNAFKIVIYMVTHKTLVLDRNTDPYKNSHFIFYAKFAYNFDILPALFRLK